MSMEDSRDYFARRAEEEISAAHKATNEKAREAHKTMAERYREQANPEMSEDMPAGLPPQPGPSSEPAI
jgi:hypothetical protein